MIMFADGSQMAEVIHKDNSIDRIEYQSLLYDFYGTLLSNSQNAVMSLYHEDNLSLSEIADELGLSRQAVHYSLKKAEHALEEYESKLHLVSSYEKNQELAAKAAGILNKEKLTEHDRHTVMSIIGKITE